MFDKIQCETFLNIEYLTKMWVQISNNLFNIINLTSFSNEG